MKITTLSLEAWDAHVAAQHHAPFLQSYAWGSFQESQGRPVHRVAITDELDEVGTCLVVQHPLAGGLWYGYIPHGPVATSSLREALYREVMVYAKKAGWVWVRGEDREDLPAAITEQYDTVATHALQPHDTRILDLTQSEEALLAQMHTKTRYNIRLAQQKGVEIHEVQADDTEYLPHFLDLLTTTATRGDFRIHDREYYGAMLKYFAHTPSHKKDTPHTTPRTRLYLAKYQGVYIAGLMAIQYGDTTTYLHGASADVHREVMAPHLLQWHAIQEAKKEGCAIYDLWGIAPEGAPATHPWSGITRFKAGFGGKTLHWADGRDMIVRPWIYRGYRLARTIRGMK